MTERPTPETNSARLSAVERRRFATNERRRGHELGTAYRHPSTVASNTASHPCRTRLSLANAITSP